MSRSKRKKEFEKLVQRIDPPSKLLCTWELKGGVSAQVTALEIERPNGQTRKMIVRRHGETDLKQNPHVAAYEFKLLQILQSVGLPAPTPLYLDQSGEVFPTSYIVIELIEGQTEFVPSDLADYIIQMATNLARIHSRCLEL
ncbi:phosphotransferase [Paenactinomyces guangxiensis]|uniref:phosphotransferase n=1 Tax=Paenactinomyces guangxiensis TaxID=1490290 RepID=UPI001E5DD3BE|nr:phosphotransferase [Paenactinomyces guangxiensis]